jgi:hypothetical protein
MPYQGKIVHLFGDLLEVSNVLVRQDRIIHQICGDDVLVSVSVTSRSPGLLEAPAASSVDGRQVPASQDAFGT